MDKTYFALIEDEWKEVVLAVSHREEMTRLQNDLDRCWRRLEDWFTFAKALGRVMSKMGWEMEDYKHLFDECRAMPTTTEFNLNITRYVLGPMTVHSTWREDVDGECTAYSIGRCFKQAMDRDLPGTTIARGFE